jgi:hypothetical protein
MTRFPSLLIAALMASLVGCASAPPSGPAGGATCADAVGRYIDSGKPGSGRSLSLGDVLGLDSDTFGPVPVNERAVIVRPGEGGKYVLAIVKTTPPDTIELFSVDARCEGGELRFETRSRYESSDGERVTRQQLRFRVMGDADGSLLVSRQLRERALGFLDLRPGGDPVEYYSFAPDR